MDVNNNGNMPDLGVLKGALAVIIGVILVFISCEVVLKVLCFTAGLALVGIGLVLLDMKRAVTLISAIIERIKGLLPRS